jgi:hypothetical protein
MNKLLIVLCISIVFTMSALVHGQGSIDFNGTSSKIQNNDANILNGSNEITICVWVKAEGWGGGDFGSIFRLDEDGSSLILGHDDSAHTLDWWITATGGSGSNVGVGVWNFPATDGGWRAVSITYDHSMLATTPVAQVNFGDVTETLVDGIGTTPVTPLTGYCVGNWSGGSRAWDGKIAHLQVFNRILTQAEKDACLRVPGSVKDGLRLWLPRMALSFR